MSLTRPSCALVYSAGFPKSESLCAIATMVFFGISSLHAWRLLPPVSEAVVTTAVMCLYCVYRNVHCISGEHINVRIGGQEYLRYAERRCARNPEQKAHRHYAVDFWLRRNPSVPMP